MIFHLTSQKEWQQAQSPGSYLPAGFTADGFIHCSDHYQIEMTANRFYLDAEDHIILEIDDERLSSPLVYENFEGGQMLFPHIYGSLNLDAVTSTFRLVRDWQGYWQLPPGKQLSRLDPVTEIPFGTPGRIFRTVMPGSRMYDPEDKVMAFLIQNNVKTVFVLNPDHEHYKHISRSLLDRYRENGIRPVHAQTEDFSAPPQGTWDNAIREAEDLLSKGQNLAIHCHTGIGRTGMFLSCLAQDLLGLPPDEAIKWVRKYIPSAVETSYQKQFVRNYRAKPAALGGVK